MRKSDFLDQLRLEIGLVYDYSMNKEDFFQRVLNRLYEMADKRCSIAVYSSLLDGGFSGTYALGKPMDFGTGFLGLGIQNATVLLRKGDEQAILAPIMEEGKVSFVILINIRTNSYKVSEADMVFVNELVRFIAAKSASFSNKENE